MPIDVRLTNPDVRLQKAGVGRIAAYPAFMTSQTSGIHEAIETRESRPESPTEFGPLLARLRRRAGVSQMELAFAARLSTRHTNFLERGKANPSRATVRRLCQALNADADTSDQLMLAAGFAPHRSTLGHSVSPSTIELRESFVMAVFIGQQSSAASVRRLGSDCLRQLGLDDVVADLDASAATMTAFETSSTEALARQVARKLICDSVREALKRLGACG